MTTPIAEDLRAWARGSYPVEAATELLIRAFRGRFAQPDHPWIRHDDRYRIDFDAITDETTAVYSGGEQRVLAVAASLGGSRQVGLGEVLASLDRPVTALLLAAFAHAAGSHRHSDLRVDPATGNADLVELGALVAWSDEPGNGPRTGPPLPTALTRSEGSAGTVLLSDSRGRISAHAPATEQDLAQAALAVRRLSDTTTPSRRGTLLYDVVRAVYDSVKVHRRHRPRRTRRTRRGRRCGSYYRSSVWNQQHRP